MNLNEQISQWSDEGRFDRIIEAAGEIPESELDMFALCQLALAYNNTDRLQDSIDLLMRVWDVGEENPVWNYYLGYALVFSGRTQEARVHLLRARELAPDIPAENILHYCVCHDGGDGPIDDDTLVGWVHDLVGGRREGDTIVLPKRGLRITPWFDNLGTESPCAASVCFRIVLDSGADLFELCAGIGETQRDAVTAALGSFYIGIYSAIGRLCRGEAHTAIMDARGRRWQVYVGEVVGMGAHPMLPLETYWELLAPAIPDYLGSRDPVYIKLYGARNGDSITAECRVDDRVSEALSERLRERIATWDSTQFASHKQFFFLQCADDVEPYPYTPEQIDDYVHAAVHLFSREDIDYGDIPPMLAEQTGDPHLADELHAFIPELCAERAFDNIASGDQIHIAAGDRTIEVTQWQVTAYRMIEAALDRGFRSNRYPENAFAQCVSASSTWSVICQARENGHDLMASGGKIQRYYHFGDDYILR